ncbi:MAG: hypothetical protein IKO27_06145 [Ruminococcus sp.]|nr:hypothetical protein [Ruminococcus sp.]
MTVAVIIIVIAVMLVMFMSFVKVPAGTAYVVERLGSFCTVFGEGIHFRIPFLDKIAAKVALTEQDLVLDRERAVSADNAEMRYTVAVRFRVTDPQQFHYGITNAGTALAKLIRTAANAVIGSLPSQEASESLEALGKKVERAVESGAGLWGILIEDISFSELYQI